MTITVEKNDFLTAIKATKTAISKSAIQPILQAIHIKTENGGLTLTGTDCTDIAKTVIEANYNSEDKLDVCINADRLDNIVSKLEDYINIEIKDANIIFKSGKTTFKCLYMDAKEFPNVNIILSEKSEDNKIILSKEEFLAGINKTCFATQNENLRSVITGVCFTFGEKSYEMAATDGNRLSQVIFDNNSLAKKEGQYIIPKQALTNISKFVKDKIEIYFENETVIFKTNNFIYVGRLLNGKFPPYSQLFPTTFEKTIAIDKSDLLKVLDKVSIMINERTNTIKFIFTKNNLQLVTECPDGDAKDDIEIDYDFEDKFQVAFNYRYILEGIKAMSSDVFTFNFNTSTSAILFLSDYNYLVMPMNIGENNE